MYTVSTLKKQNKTDVGEVTAAIEFNTIPSQQALYELQSKLFC